MRSRGSRKRIVGGVALATIALVVSGAIAVQRATRSDTVTILTNDVQTAGVGAANGCPRGSEAVAGGFKAEQRPADPSSPSISVVASYRSARRIWETTGQNSGPPGDLTSYAYCRAQELASNAEKESVPAGVHKTVIARCPGTQAASGGFDAATNASGARRISPDISRKRGKRSWVVAGTNLSTAGAKLKAQVNCKRGRALETKRKRAGISSPNAAVATKRATAKCPRGQRVVSGGFKSADPATQRGPFFFVSKKSGRRTWTVAARVTGPRSTAFTAFAYCTS